MELPEQWIQAFELSGSDVALKTNVQTGATALTGDQELSDLLSNVVTDSGEIRIVLSS